MTRQPIETTYIVGRLLDSVRPAFNPASPSLLNQSPYSLAESLLELPNASRVASKDVVLAIYQPEMTGDRTSSHYPPYPFYYRVNKTPTVPSQTVQLERSSSDANTVDVWPLGVLSPDLLNILDISSKISIQGKTYYRGTDYDLDSLSNPTGILWLTGGNRPAIALNYSIVIQYSTREFDQLRLKTGLVELEMLPTLTTSHLGDLYYRVDYLSLPILTNSQKQAIANNIDVFDERTFTPFHTERWRIPIRFNYRREHIRIELDETGLLIQGTLRLQQLVWTYSPTELELEIEDLSDNSKTVVAIPNPNNSVYLLSPEGLIWTANTVFQSVTSGLLDPQQYRLSWFFSYQPAFSISDVYWRKTRPGVSPGNPNYVYNWYMNNHWFPCYYYF